MKNKIIWIILLSTAVIYLTYVIFIIVKYRFKADWNLNKQYTWIFKDSVVNKIDTTCNYSYYTKEAVYNNFHYRDNDVVYNIIVWEFKNYKTLEFDQINFVTDYSFDNVKFKTGQTLNKGDDLEITLKYGYAFNKYLKVYLDKSSIIEKTIENKNYKGFYGTINEMLFSNENDLPQILFDYIDGKQPSLFLVYKGHNSFYLILINSLKPFDENIIDILNLS